MGRYERGGEVKKVLLFVAVVFLSGCAVHGRFIDDRAGAEVKIVRGDIYCENGRRKAFVYILQSEGGATIRYVTEQKLHVGDVLKIIKVEEVN
jgi:hypothetical protein